MADSKTNLDKGFKEVPLDSGFQDVPISDSDKAALSNYMQTDRPDSVDAFVSGAKQGISANFAPRIEAAAKAGLERLSYGPDVSNPPSISDLYDQYLAEKQKSYQEAEAAHPIASVAGNLTGGLGLAGIVPVPGGIASKVVPGFSSAASGAGYGALSAVGAQKDPLLSSATPENALEGAALGTAFGAATPALFSGASQVAKKTKDASKFLYDVLGGQVLGEMGGGFEQGLAGHELVSTEAPKRVGKEINELAKKATGGLKENLDELAIEKTRIIKAAQDAGVKIKPEEVDAFLANQHAAEPKSNLEEVSGDFERLKALLEDAQKGKEQQVVNRRFYGNGNTEQEKFMQRMKMNEVAENASQGEVQQASPRDDFENRAKQKEVEQNALAGQQDPTPHQITYEPIPGDPNHEMGIVKQPQYDEQGNFSGYKKVMSEVLPTTAPEAAKPEIIFQDAGIPGKKVAIRRIPIKNDSGEITGYKVLNKALINTEDAAPFKDFTETVRAGGNDLTNPEEMYQLYKDLKARGKFGDYSFRTDEGKAQAGQATQQVQEMLRGSIPELQPIDQNISALKTAADKIGMDTYENPDESEIWKKVGKMITDAYGENGMKSANAESDLNHFINQIKIANPTLGHEIEQKAAEIGTRARITGAAQKDIYLPRPMSTARAVAAKIGNIAGYGIYNATPEWMMNTASQLKQAGSKAAQEVGNIVAQAASKDQLTRNGIMFGLMQNPAYRQILQPYAPENDQMMEKQK